MTPLEAARARIVSDHALLRTRMTSLIQASRAAVSDEKQRPHVRAALATLRETLEEHLDFEEHTLFPLLDQAWGPSRVERMAREHASQRAALDALTEDALDGGRGVHQLADELDWFVRGLEREMLGEEKTFLGTDGAPQRTRHAT